MNKKPQPQAALLCSAIPHHIIQSSSYVVVFFIVTTSLQTCILVSCPNYHVVDCTLFSERIQILHSCCSHMLLEQQKTSPAQKPIFSLFHWMLEKTISHIQSWLKLTCHQYACNCLRRWLHKTKTISNVMSPEHLSLNRSSIHLGCQYKLFSD